MAQIRLFRILDSYDDYANASIYRYDDDMEEYFYFDATFGNEERGKIESGKFIEQPKYDVLISNLGKRKPGLRKPDYVHNIDVVKSNIRDFFRTNSLSVAKIPPRSVVFK